MNDDNTELPMVFSKIGLVIGDERYEVLVEDVRLTHEDNFDRMSLRLIFPDKLNQVAVIKLARALQESSIAQPMRGPIDDVRRIDTPAQMKEEFGGEAPIEHEAPCSWCEDDGSPCACNDGEPEHDSEHDSFPMTVDDAIEHTKRIAYEHQYSDYDCTKSHMLLAEWLEELKDRRDKEELLQNRVRSLSRSLQKAKEQHREFRRVSSTSQDYNVHMKLTITQLDKGWMNAHEISEMAFDMANKSKEDLLLDVGDRLLRETIGGFVVDLVRRPGFED